MTFHVLVCGLVAGDLDELDYAQHGDPDELEPDPNCEDDGERVAFDSAAERLGEDIAFDVRWSGECFDI